LLAAGRPQALMRFNLVLLGIYAAAVLATAPYGIVVVAIAVVGVYVVQLLGVYAVLFRRVIGIPVGRMVGDLAPAVVGTAVVLALGFPLVDLLRTATVPPALIVAAAAAVGVLAHCSVLRLLFPSVWHDLFMLARRVLPARRSPRPAPAASQALSAPR
jgi:hypothetical protein